MANSPSRVGAWAAFAAAVFAIGVGAIFVLERVGAPDRLVLALGPLASLGGVAGLGVLTRAKTQLEFFVARRAVPPLYAGVALALTIGGFALAFSGASEAPGRLPWRGVALGVAASAILVGPCWRTMQASALADLLATRFPAASTRVAFALVSCVCGWAVAASGIGYAALSVRDAPGLSATTSATICAVAVVISLAPGGMRGLVWTDAAGGAAAVAVMALFAALAQRGGGEDAARIEAAARAFAQAPGSTFLPEIAAFAATLGLFLFASPALSVASASAARRSGFVALAVLALAAAAAALSDLSAKSASDSALASLVVSLPALALARAGLFAASRAGGLDLWRASKRLSVLASRRMAVTRGGVILGGGVALGVALASPQPSAPFYLSLALWLAFAAPSLLLTALPGRSSWPGNAALAGAVAAALAGRFAGLGDPSYGPDLLVSALGAAMAGVAAGLAAFVLRPDSAASGRLEDPFVDLPGESLN